MKDLLVLTTEQKLKLHELGLKFALAKLPYRFGAEVNLSLPPDEIISKQIAFDCSELVEYFFYQIGYKIPDGSINQYWASQEIDKSDMTIGDLVFKRNKVIGKIGHVGLLVCNSEVPIVCEAEGFYGKVILRGFNEFTKETQNNEFAGVRRLLVEKVVRI